jgi:protein SCO1/2
MRSVLASIAMLLLGTAALWLGTDGFQAFTAEGARRLAVAETPRQLPAVRLQDSSGATFGLEDYRGKLILVTFIYTRCPYICTVMADSFEHIYQVLPSPMLEREVALLSVSFDPRYDGPAELAAYAKRYGAAGPAWRFARVADAMELKALLDAFGIVVIPDEYGGFEHNAAIHLVDRRGRLARIFDYEAPKVVLKELELWTGP